VNTGTLFRQVEALMPVGRVDPRATQFPLTPRAKQALELAGDEAAALGHDRVSPEHLLLGLMVQSEGEAAQLLQARGLSIEEMRRVGRTITPPEDRDAMMQPADRPVLFASLDPAASDLDALVSQTALPIGSAGEAVIQGVRPELLGRQQSLVEIRLAGVMSNFAVVDRQLSFTQVALGGVMGMIAGAAAGAMHWIIIGAFAGMVVALVRRVLLGMIGGAVAGGLVGWFWGRGPAVGVAMGALFGAILGGCLGDWRRSFWRPQSAGRLIPGGEIPSEDKLSLLKRKNYENRGAD
jgi:hypothetical protein